MTNLEHFYSMPIPAPTLDAKLDKATLDEMLGEPYKVLIITERIVLTEKTMAPNAMRTAKDYIDAGAKSVEVIIHRSGVITDRVEMTQSKYRIPR